MLGLCKNGIYTSWGQRLKYDGVGRSPSAGSYCFITTIPYLFFIKQQPFEIMTPRPLSELDNSLFPVTMSSFDPVDISFQA